MAIDFTAYNSETNQTGIIHKGETSTGTIIELQTEGRWTDKVYMTMWSAGYRTESKRVRGNWRVMDDNGNWSRPKNFDAAWCNDVVASMMALHKGEATTVPEVW